ncbi:protein of unknown function (DUF2431) [Fragilaria crotonensis]|nr:protein of unknown function (DUF2431) [Fragilaria crotonensis]
MASIASLIAIDGWALSRSKHVFPQRQFELGLFTKAAETTLDPSLLDVSRVSSWLVCGDGDLSYSAAIAPFLSQSNVSLTATVLEDQNDHHDVYTNSQRHSETISSYTGAAVRFGIDATRLEHHFPGQHFDRIQFNFPHWRGKANNRRNRELLSAFFSSAVQVLSPQGEILIALCQGQGGSHATTMQEWKGSWMAALYAAECGLILHSVDKCNLIHNLSSHRGVDRPFRIGMEPNLYRFRFPNGSPVVRHLQLCCRHELHICGPNSNMTLSGFGINDILDGNAVKQFTQTSIIPEGVNVDIPLRDIRITPEGDTLIVYLMVYRAESLPLTRALVDSFRCKLETEIGNIVQLRQNRAGRMVSKSFPCSALDAVITEAKCVEESVPNINSALRSHHGDYDQDLNLAPGNLVTPASN